MALSEQDRIDINDLVCNTMSLLGQLLFPFPVVSASLLDSLARFAAKHPDDPGLTRMLAELSDVGSRALRSRAL